MGLIYSGDYHERVGHNINQVQNIIRELNRTAVEKQGDMMEKVYKNLSRKIGKALKAYKKHYEIADQYNAIVFSTMEINYNFSACDMTIMERELLERNIDFYVWSQGKKGISFIDYKYRLAIKMH